MVVSSNIFLSNKVVGRIIKPVEFYKLAVNIEKVWTCSKPGSIPFSTSIFSIRNFDDWYFNSNIF